MRNSAFLWVIVAIMVMLDIYFFQAVKVIIPGSFPKMRVAVMITYWVISIIAVGIIILLPYINYDAWPRSIRSYLFTVIIGMFLSKLVASIFFAIDDIRRGGLWAISKLVTNPI